MRYAIPLLLLTLLAVPPRARAADDAPPDEVKKLISQLGDDDFARRDAAAAKLKEIGKPALPALKRAAESTHPEVSARAQALVKRIEIRPVPGMDPAFLNGNIAAGGRVAMSVVDGNRVLEVSEGGREIKITEGADRLAMTVAGWIDGVRATEEFAAETPEQLKFENPEAYALYARFANAGPFGFAAQGRFGGRVNGVQMVQQLVPPDELDILRARLDKQMRDAKFKDAQRDDVFKELEKVVGARTDRALNKGMDNYTQQCDAFRKTLEQNKLDPGDLLPPPAATRLGVSISNDPGRLVVQQVSDQSRAERLGLKPGDLIRKVDGKEIATVAELRKAVSAKAKGLTMDITRDGDDMQLEEKDAGAKEKPAK